MELRLDKESLVVYRALASDSRLSILQQLSQKPATATELAKILHLSKTTLSRHLNQLRQAGLIQVKEDSQNADRRQKIVSLSVDSIEIVFPSKIYLPFDRVTQKTPIGYYSDFQAEPTCGLASRTKIIGVIDDPRSFTCNDRIRSQLLWFSSGFVSYRLQNPLDSNQHAEMLDISMEICSEYPGSNNEWKSDILFTINDVDVGSWTSPGNFSDVRGVLTPSWWKSNLSQYGNLIHLRINHEDSTVNGKRISGCTLNDLRLHSSPFLTVKIGTKPDSPNQGGLTIFGKYFGNHAQDIVTTLYYSEPSVRSRDSGTLL